MASKQQGWAIYVHLGYDVRNAADVSYEEASKIIAMSMAGDKEGAIALLEKLGATKKREVGGAPKESDSKPDKPKSWKEIHEEAHAAATAAADGITPVPMLVVKHKNVLDDNSPAVKVWEAPFGSCGTAWLGLDGRSGFTKWLVKNRLAHKHDDGGVTYHGYNPVVEKRVQSYERQCEYARVYAETIRRYGISSDFRSRED